ncbi:MAG TPA: patatin-like phospholipase family protein, partial [Candidatus Hydrogenedentes bacterium]|nr:patatin-like phospholipase family protein [Candidatus Hydrogenedentota bacterium]
MDAEHLLERLMRSGPKRILSLDGGGIRGLIALEYLRRMERHLADQHGQPDFRLSDYFDLIGGTSTGSLIACGLALGWRVDELIERYEKLSRVIFTRRVWKAWESFYSHTSLESILDEILGAKSLGDPALKTGLCVFCRRLDTGSVWKFFNHPNGKFYGENRNIRLADLVRASTAAPTVFRPHSFTVTESIQGLGERGTFIDGSVGTTHDPSLHLLWVATLKGFPFQWKSGPDELLLASVGTVHWA